MPSEMHPLLVACLAPALPRPRKWWGQLKDGRGYSATLTIWAPDEIAAMRTLKRYCEAEGYMAGAVKPAIGCRPGWEA